ncbi:MAG: hypothetical protein ACR2RL_02845, partial [Gammaproteobacteria bacterium]
MNQTDTVALEGYRQCSRNAWVQRARKRWTSTTTMKQLLGSACLAPVLPRSACRATDLAPH